MDKTSSDFSPYLTKQEAAHYIRRSLRKLELFVKAGHLVPAKIDRKLLFARAELEKFVEEHRVA